MTSQSAVRRATDMGKTWVRICAHGSWKLIQLPALVRRVTDIPRIEALRQEMRTTSAEPTSAAKYADFEYWLAFNVHRIASLSLHEAAPMRILDIGCGPGYFLAAARACGHDVFGVDIPRDFMTPIERRVYAELLAALDLTSRTAPLFVQRFVPLAIAQDNLDLITAFWICFNCHTREDEWGAAEWRFFLNDALTHLKPGGVLHLELNSNPARYSTMEWYDQETLDLFRSFGLVDRNIVRIRRK